MGIYPNTTKSEEVRLPDGKVTWMETWSVPGLTKVRTVVASEWAEERDDCFCCSCGEYGNSDPFCRNHGFAGERPCEVHNMPGGFDPEMGVTEMPESVQAHNAKRKEY